MGTDCVVVYTLGAIANTVLTGIVRHYLYGAGITSWMRRDTADVTGKTVHLAFAFLNMQAVYYSLVATQFCRTKKLVR